MGFIHATPGDMKSFRSSAERMALMVGGLDGAMAGRKWFDAEVATSAEGVDEQYTVRAQNCEERAIGAKTQVNQ